jgi:hypothetical protein
LMSIDGVLGELDDVHLEQRIERHLRLASSRLSDSAHQPAPGALEMQVADILGVAFPMRG